MRDADGQRLQLKSKLLAGAAGMTAAAMGTAAFAADAASPTGADASAAPAPIAAPAAPPVQTMTPIAPPKWLPYVDIGGGVGSGFTIGRANAFVPVWQDVDSLMFVRFGADTRTRYNNNFNIGAGYRAKFDDEWILGAFAGFDSSQTDYNHTFNQVSLGLEAMSADWDIRANAYLAKKTNRAIGDKFQLYIHDTTIAILQGQEAALSGFDGEVGYRVFNTDSTDVRVFAGAYTFHHADVNTAGISTNFSFPYHDVTGPKVRAEVNVFDLDMLGSQSRFSVEGQVSHDSVNHTSEYIGATLRIALDDPSGPGAQALDDLDRRMADPVRRQDNVLTQWQFNKPEPVIIYNGAVTSKPTNTFYYAEQRSSSGAGTYTDQTTIQDATSRGAGRNAFIVLTDAGGSTIDATGTTVHSGETLTGAGTFKIRGANSTYPVFTHDFAPGSGAVSLSATSGNVLNIDGDANIAGLSIVGPFVDGIYGANVGNVTIANVTIDGGGAGTNGIVFQQTNTSGTSTISIKSSSITGVTNDGIDLGVSATSGATSTTNLIFSDGSISAGNDGVAVTANSTGTSSATVYAGIHDSTITAGGTGAGITGTASGGGTLDQTLLVDPTTINAGIYGLHVTGYAKGGSLTQNLVDTDGTIDGGVSIYGYAHGGALTQNIGIDNVTISPSRLPLYIGAYADGGSISQTVSMSNVVANGAAHDAVDIFAGAYGQSTVDQTITLSDIQANSAGHDALNIESYAEGGSTVNQAVYVSDLTANDADHDGVSLTSASDGASNVSAYVGIHDSTIAASYAGIDVDGLTTASGVLAQTVVADPMAISADDYGIYLHGNAKSGVLTQSLMATDATVDGGVSIYGEAHGGSLTQTAAIDNVTILPSRLPLYISAYADAGSVNQTVSMDNLVANGGTQDDISILASAHGHATVHQTVELSHVQANDAASDGIDIGAAAKYGATTIQTVDISYLTASHNGGAGIYASAGALSLTTDAPSVVAQYISVNHATLTGNAAYGVQGQLFAVDNAVGRQDVAIENATITGSYLGVAISTYAIGGASTQQNIYLAYDTIQHNTGDGVAIGAIASGDDGFAAQYVSAYHVDASYNGADGFEFGAFSTSADAEQEVYLVYVTADHEGRDGVEIRSNATGTTTGAYTTYPAHVEQSFVIAYGDLSHNVEHGLEIYNYAGFGAQIDQTIGLYGMHLDYNGRDGVRENSIAYSPYYGAPGYKGPTHLYSDLSVTGGTADHNSHYGIDIESAAYGPTNLTQHITISGADVSHNGYDGFDDNLLARGVYSENVHYVTLADSKFDSNGGDGAYLGATQYFGPGPYGVALQFVTITGSDFSHNADNGLELEAHAAGYNGRAEQYVTISGSSFSNNGEDGIHAFAYAGRGGSLTGYSCDVVQSTVGYCAIIRERIDIDGSTIENNGRSGLYVGSVAYKYGAIYAQSGHNPLPTLYVSNSTISGNAFAGISLFNYLAFGSYQFQYVVIDKTKITNNGTDGGYVFAPGPSFPVPVLQGGLAVTNEIKYGSAQSQYVIVQNGSTISDNKGFGISVLTDARSGYGVTNLLEVLGSTVDGNYGGVFMETYASHIYTSLSGRPGDVNQEFYSSGSHFDDNITGGTGFTAKYSGSGVAQLLVANHIQGNVYQYLGSAGSTFSGNEYSGAAASAIIKYAGSFDQVVKSAGDSFVYNDGAGIAVRMDSKYNYGINHQNISLTGDTANNNGYAGLDVLAHLDQGSYLNQQILIADSHFDDNAEDGVYVDSYVTNGSTLLQTVALYSYHATSSASGNGGNGVRIVNDVRNGSTLDSSTYTLGVDVSNNANVGVYIDSYSASGTLGHQKNYITGNTISGNTTGIALYAEGAGIGPGASSGGGQYSQVTNNSITGNTHYGVYGYVRDNAYQYIQVYTGGNTISGNGTNYGFFAAGGGSYILN